MEGLGVFAKSAGLAMDLCLLSLLSSGERSGRTKFLLSLKSFNLRLDNKINLLSKQSETSQGQVLGG